MIAACLLSYEECHMYLVLRNAYVNQQSQIRLHNRHHSSQREVYWYNRIMDTKGKMLVTVVVAA